MFVFESLPVYYLVVNTFYLAVIAAAVAGQSRLKGGGIDPVADGVKLCKVDMLLILKQGLNRQIRRMCEHFGYEVTRLVRIRVMNIRLGKLKEGRYRDLSKDERNELFLELGL